MENQRLAVGDRVQVQLLEVADGQDARGVIEAIEPRRSILRRPRENKRDQVLCANIDTVFVVAAAGEPRYNRAFLDRVLIAIEREGLQAALVINKLDLVEDEEELDALEEDLSDYSALGYEVLLLSVTSGIGIEDMVEVLKGRVTAFTGPSGVGKSTLLNALVPGLELRTGEVGRAGKGRHITTSAQLVRVPTGGWVVDTPGVRSFGIQGLLPSELAGYFLEMRPLLGHCRFGDCRHLEEPGCAIAEAAEAGDIAQGRYESYLKIYDDLEDEQRSHRRPRRAGGGKS